MIQKLNLQILISKFRKLAAVLQHYSVAIFIVFVAILYGFLVFKINGLSNTQPSSSEVTNQVNAAQIPHIDPLVVLQLQTLRDNSVNVQTLFNQARSNRFQ